MIKYRSINWLKHLIVGIIFSFSLIIGIVVYWFAPMSRPYAFTKVTQNNFAQISQKRSALMYVGSSRCPFCRAYKDLPPRRFGQLLSYMADGNTQGQINLLNDYHGYGPFNTYAIDHQAYGYFDDSAPFESDKLFPDWVRTNIFNVLRQNYDNELAFIHNKWEHAPRPNPDDPFDPYAIDSLNNGPIPVTIVWDSSQPVKWTLGYLTLSKLEGFVNYKV